MRRGGSVGPRWYTLSVLLELHVENLLLIERAHLRLASGLNVLTGETGAGKTVLAHALDLLLGGKARPGIVRPGAAEAIFSIARIAGLIAHAMEEYPHRLRFRPRAAYTGPAPHR